MDHDLGPVAVEAQPDPIGCVEVERVASPGDRTGGTGEGRVREGGDEGAAEPATRPGDGDAHQPRLAGSALAAAA